MYPNIRVIFDRRNATKNGKNGAVEIEVYFNRQRKWLPTYVSVSAKQWSEKNGVVSHPDSYVLNRKIDAAKKKVSDYVSILIAKGDKFTFEGLSGYIESSKLGRNVVEFIENAIDERTDISAGTIRNHRKIVTALRDFNRIKTFDDVTPAMITEFDKWLHKRGYLQVTVSGYHKLFKVYLNIALTKGLIDSYPYAGIKIDGGKSPNRKYLTEDELERIKNCKSLTKSLQRVRDMFLFQCYTGLAYADMRVFNFSDVVERDGRYILHSTRVKSEESYYIVLIEPAMEILRKYDNILPMMTNEQYNMRLKSVADCSGVEKRITSHMARHTFAVNSLNAGIPIEVVSKMLGHTNTNTTQIYAKVVNKTVDSAFDLIEQKLKEKQ